MNKALTTIIGIILFLLALTCVLIGILTPIPLAKAFFILMGVLDTVLAAWCFTGGN